MERLSETPLIPPITRFILVQRPMLLVAMLVLVQGVPNQETLRPPDATLSSELTRVVAVRELADGRVLVADAGAKALMVADFRTLNATRIGREGDGPGEYRSVGQLFSIGSDSTILVDIAGGRWLMLHGTSIAQTLSASDPVLRDGVRVPLGADTSGFVLGSRIMGAPASPTALPTRLDSAFLVRIHRGTGRTDTIAALQSRRTRIQSTSAEGRIASINVTSNPMASGDIATVFADGAIAIARVNPYRVDWHFADNRMVRGPRLPFTEIPLDDRERRSALQRRADLSGGTPPPPESVVDWPDFVPPFLPGAALAAPDGRLWIRRTPTAAAAETRYDVVDRNGLLVRRVTMAPDEHVVGFGRNAVYSLRTDGDGIQHLRRHPSFARGGRQSGG